MVQLDLFRDFTPATCTVIPFPVCAWGRMVWGDRVEPVAKSLLRRKSESGRQKLWTGEIDVIVAGLRCRGADEAGIVRELDRFRSLVIQDMARRRNAERRGPETA